MSHPYKTKKNDFTNMAGASKQISYKYENISIFLKALMINPRGTGAICPSSKRLAKEMVSQVFLDDQEGIIIELGGGTGVVTEQLIQASVPPEKIIVIEYSAPLAKTLRNRFPTVKIIEGNAVDLAILLKNNLHKVNTIISSLPLRSLPETTAQLILQQIKSVLPIGGHYIQFTYSFTHNKVYSLSNFQEIYSKRIWLNLPPARVDVWKKQSN